MSGTRKIVSVIIPTHNRCDILKRAILSALNQTYDDIETIVVSDGSTDNTRSVVESIMQIDKRLRFIEYQPSRGANVARNIGIKSAIGEYIAFLDDDDEWKPNKLELQIEEFERNPNIGLVYTGVHIIYVNEKVEYNSKARNRGDLKRRILIDNCIGTTSTVVCKRDLFDKAGVFDTNLEALQDYDLWIRCCQFCEVGIIPEELINYYNYTNGKSSEQISSSTEKYKEAFKYINKKYENHFSKLNSRETIDKLNSEIVLIINKALRNGDQKEARKYIKELSRIGNKKRAFLYFFISFLSYKTILKIRSIS